MSDEERRARAERRSHTMTLEGTDRPTSGADAISLVTRLTRASWALAGLPYPAYSRGDTPIRFAKR